MIITNLAELARELSAFTIRDTHLTEHVVDGNPGQLSSHWEVWFEKPSGNPASQE